MSKNTGPSLKVFTWKQTTITVFVMKGSKYFPPSLK
jgi:hypothetical protein